MKLIPFLTLCAILTAAGVCAAAEGQIVIPAGSRPSAAASQKNFIGTVRVDPAFQSQEPARSYGAYVTFEPGARTNWHIHPLGQTLIVTSGKGVTQEWGKPAKFIKPGDVVICPPGIKHWHGAAPDTAMTHLAIGERAEGKGAQWFEPVGEPQYQKAASAASKEEKQ